MVTVNVYKQSICDQVFSTCRFNSFYFVKFKKFYKSLIVYTLVCFVLYHEWPCVTDMLFSVKRFVTRPYFVFFHLSNCSSDINMKFDLIIISMNVSQMSQFPVLYSNFSTASCSTDWVYRTTTWRCCHRASQTSSISGSSTSARTVRKPANSSPLSFSFLESSYAIGWPITEAEAHWYLPWLTDPLSTVIQLITASSTFWISVYAQIQNSPLISVRTLANPSKLTFSCVVHWFRIVCNMVSYNRAIIQINKWKLVAYLDSRIGTERMIWYPVHWWQSEARHWKRFIPFWSMSEDHNTTNTCSNHESVYTSLHLSTAALQDLIK